MKIITTGTGPDHTWATEEQREWGERQLLADFARELDRALAGRRARPGEILTLVERDEGLRRAWDRAYWAFTKKPYGHQRLGKLLRRILGTRFDATDGRVLTKRWDPRRRHTYWGFENLPPEDSSEK
jgi:hypothetical protein